MRFGNILFPSMWSLGRDHEVIHETVREARLTEELGFDAVWLAEHHFSGHCIYTDPVTFAAAIAAITQRVRIGFAVVQAPLHHPVRLAEQISLLDNLSRGRLIVGFGRGARFALNEARVFGADHSEGQDRLEEAEKIVLRCLTGDEGEHAGSYWNLRIPRIRPQPFTRPHPQFLRAVSRDSSFVEVAKRGAPFVSSHKTNRVTRQQVGLYRETMRDAGFSEEQVTQRLAESWTWRRVFVAETDAEAERVGMAALTELIRGRTESTDRGNALMGIATPHRDVPITDEVFTHGSPATVAEVMADLDDIGIGGVILQFRLGEMPTELAAQSLRLFAERVRPLLESRGAPLRAAG